MTPIQNLTSYNTTIHYQNKEIFDLLVDEIFYQETYKFYSEKEEPFIIDCGSNIGLSVLYFKTCYPKSTILAFEPHAGNYELLVKNIAEHNLQNIETINCVLSNQEGVIDFFGDYRENGDTIGCTTIEKLSHLGAFEKRIAETRKLSSFINQEVDLLKIDIEGSEYDVLQDLIQEKKLSFIRRLHIELHGTRDELESLKIKFRKEMEACNFIIEERGLSRNPSQMEIYEKWSRETGIACCEFFCENKDYIEENPFELEIVSKQWVQLIENEKGTDRENLIYPYVADWAEKLNNKTTVLEIGCGTGICSDLVSNRLHYIGIDDSALLIKKANEGTISSKRFIKCNIYDIPLENKSIDGIFSVGVLFHIKDQPRAFMELYKKLSKNGKVLFITANPDTYELWKSDYLEKTESNIKTSGAIKTPSGVLDYNIFFFYERTTILKNLSSCGFKNIHIHKLQKQENDIVFWIAIEAEK